MRQSLELCNKVLKEVFEEILGVKFSSVARIHRLGKASRDCPVILYFQDYFEKQAMFCKCGKLKGTRLILQNDYSSDTLRQRKQLWKSAEAERLSGKWLSLIHERLHIDNQYFVWDDATNTRTACKYPVKAAKVA